MWTTFYFGWALLAFRLVMFYLIPRWASSAASLYVFIDEGVEFQPST